MEWQPIETAPKDGRKALVYRPLAENSSDEQEQKGEGNGNGRLPTL